MPRAHRAGTRPAGALLAALAICACSSQGRVADLALEAAAPPDRGAERAGDARTADGVRDLRRADLGARLPTDPGPFAIGTLAGSLSIAKWGTYPLNIYYPAKSAGASAPPEATGAPYPAVVFAHGHGGNKDANTWVGRHLATWGYVVIHFGAHAILVGEALMKAADPAALLAEMRGA